MTHVVLAGGGTAGHTSPLIATAQALRRLEIDVDITCVGTPRGLETRVIPEAGFTLELVPPVVMPRKVSKDLFTLPFRLTSAVAKARRILSRAKADVVVGFGGYASVSAYLAARSMGIPVVVHEQNVLPGMANKLAARFAKAVLTSFEETKLPGAVFEGMPLRASITELASGCDLPAAKERFELPPVRPVLLVSGGSQGACSLNEATVDASVRLLAAGVSILHVWGPKNFPAGAAFQVDEATGARYVPLSYVNDMAEAYAAADLMLARAGAGTVCETASIGLPTILVPLPIGNGEQALNAKGVEAAGAAIVVPDAEMDADRLCEIVTDLIGNDRLPAMAAAGPSVMAPGADERVARRVLDVAGQR